MKEAIIMDFELKEIKGLFKIVLFGILGLVLLYAFLNFLPFILLIALVVWSGYKLIRYVKTCKNKNSPITNTVNNADYSTMESEEKYTNGQIIDVDYEEVK